MEQLLPWVEAELKQFRRKSAEFAVRYPRLAGRLIPPREGVRDPHVDRLVQAAALLHARIAHSLDRASPLLDEALLEALFPETLAPFPASAIFRLSASARRGTALAARAADGRVSSFRLTGDACTGADVTSLRWRPYEGPGGEHLLSLTVSGLSAPTRDTLRLYVNAEPVLRAALQDALLLHASSAWSAMPGGPAEPLPRVPMRVAGLDELGDYNWQVLREYQCFPERFNFLELNLASLRRFIAYGNVSLDIAVQLRADSELARTLAGVEAGHLLTGCAPAANVFAAAAAPVYVSRTSSEYGLAPADSSHVIHAIDTVHLLAADGLSVLQPPQTMRFGAAPTGTWTARRALLDEPGTPMRISFAPAPTWAASETGTATATASVGLTCCERSLPQAFAGFEPAAALIGTPCRMREVAGGMALRWRLLAMLALEANPANVENLRLAFALQDLAESDAGRKLRDALADLKTRPATMRMRHKHGAAPVDGTELRMTIDERALVGASVAVFVHVIDQYLSHSVHLNTFMQLVAISASSGEELLRCRPRNGNLML